MLMLAIIGHTWADQLLPQLLMEQFDTFPIQCTVRHIRSNEIYYVSPNIISNSK